MADHHEEIILGLQPVEWAQWMHHPLTEAFFVFLGDQEANFMAAITERFIAGTLYGQPKGDGADSQDRNAHVLRGRVLALREAQRITLPDLQAFYRDKRGLPQDESEDDRADARSPAGDGG